jgi:hypothetical protein
VADAGLVPWLGGIQINNGYTGTISIATNLTVNSLLLGNARGATATVTVNAGKTLIVNGSTLQGGTLNGNGALELAAGTMTVGAPSTEDVNTFTIDANSQLSINDDLGILSGLSLAFNANFTQTGGVVDLGNGGTLDLLNNLANGAYTLSGGTLKGTGSITNVELTQSGGTLEVSGVLNLSGDYTEQAGSTFQVDASADNQNNWGQLKVTGTATLSGGLFLNLAQGYNPVGGANANAYTILTANQVVGSFPQPNGWTESAANTSPVTLKKN